MSRPPGRGGTDDETIVVRPVPASFSNPAHGVTSEHAFSAGSHYDPANTHHGLLLAHDEHRLAPAAGFPRHLHRGVDVVSIVLSGTLRHSDDAGGDAFVPAWSVSSWGPGDGAQHSEHASTAGPARVLQLHLAGDRAHPHRTARIDSLPRRAGWALAAGDGGALELSAPRTEVLVRHLERGASVTVPGAPWSHLTVAAGAVAARDRFGAHPVRVGSTVRAEGAASWVVRAEQDSLLVVVVNHVDLRQWLETPGGTG